MDCLGDAGEMNFENAAQIFKLIDRINNILVFRDYTVQNFIEGTA